MSKEITEKTGVVGFVPKDKVSEFKSNVGKDGTVDIRFEPGKDQILMRLKRQDIIEVITGSEIEGDIRLHVLLKPGSHVETAIKSFRDVSGIEDPTLSRLSAASMVSVSFV